MKLSFLAKKQVALKTDFAIKRRPFLLILKKNLKALQFWKWDLKTFFKIVFYCVKHPKQTLKIFWKDVRDFFGWSFGALPRKTVSIFLIALFVLLPLFNLFFAKKADAAWWNETWLYRSSIAISNSSGSVQTDFQVKVLDAYDVSALVSAGKIQASFGDLRFVDSAGKILPYWIETGSTSSSLTVWAKLPSIPTSGATVYLYYGNPTAASQSSIDSTMVVGGLRAYYYDGINFNTLLGTCIDTNLNHDWGTGYVSISDCPNNRTDTVSIKWKGWIANEGSGNHTFYGTSDDGQKLYVGGTLLVNDWNDHGSNEVGSSPYSLSAATAIEYQYYENTAAAVAKLGWSPADGSGKTYPIPASHLYSSKYAMTQPVSAAPSTEEKGPGPVGYWKFDEGTGMTAHDSTGRNNSGTLTDMSATPSPTSGWQTEDQCVSGKCLAFDNSDDGVDINKNFTDLTDYTMCSWINPRGNHKNYTGTIMSSGDWNVNHWAFGINQGNTQIQARKPDGVTNFSWNYTFPLNTWTYVCMTRAGSSLAAYANGNMLGSPQTGATGNLVSNVLNTMIGRETYLGGYFAFNGKLDEPKIYPYARTQEQIQTDYNAGLAGISANKGTAASFGDSSDKWLTDGLVGYWKMDESSGNTADSSGSGSNGIPTGTTVVSGKFGNGRNFAGNSNYISNNTSVGSTATVSAWAKGATDGTMLWRTGPSGTGPDLFFTTGKIALNIWDGANNSFCSIPSTATDGNWHLYTTVISSSYTALYYDGALCGTATYRNPTSSSFTISSGAGYDWSGSIDETRIYNRALSPDEVQKLYDYAPGPVGYWKLDESTGTVANDSSGNNNTGTLTNGPTWTQGKVGGGVNLDGTNDYIAIPDSNSLDTTSGVTLAGWVKFNGLAEYQNIIAKRGADGSPSNYFLRTGGSLSGGDTNQIQFGYHNGGYYIVATTTANLVTNQWYYVSATHDDSGEKIFINGTIYATVWKWGSSSAALLADTEMLAFGKAGNYSGEYANVAIDDVRIYNYARTQEQILQDMTGNVSASDLQTTKEATAYYKFDEGNGTTANNLGTGGSALNGTLTNMAAPATATSGWTDNGKVGKAINFDGSNDYVSIPLQNAIASGSLGIWINPKSFSYGRYIFDSSNLYVRMVDSSGNLYFANHSSGSLTTYLIPNVNQWYHLFFIWTPSNVSVYANGTLVFNGALANGGLTSYLNIGSGDIGNFNGAIDEVKIFPYALSSDDVKIEYNRGNAVNMASSGLMTAGGSSTSARAEYCPPGNVEGNCALNQSPSPVGEWKLDEGTGLTANDSSGNGNAGTLTNGPTWTQGRFGKGLNFDGVNDGVTVASNVSGINTKTATVSMWFKTPPVTSYSSNGISVAELSTDFNSHDSFLVSYNDQSGGSVPTMGGLMLNMHSAAGYSLFSSNNRFDDNKWHHVEAVFDQNQSTAAAQSTLYVDGKREPLTQVGGYNAVHTTSFASSPMYFGGTNGTSRFFQGALDQVRIYNYARTPAQVAWDYDRGGPMAWWKMDECQGGTIHDSSGNGISGTLTVGSGGTQTAVGTCTTASSAWGNGATGKFNSSLNFDGTDDAITTSSNIPGIDSKTVTVSMWFKTPTVSSYVNKMLFELAGDITSHDAFAIGFNDDTGGTPPTMGGIDLAMHSAAGYSVYSSNNRYDDNAWHHLVAVFDRTQATATTQSALYIDGSVSPMTNVNYSAVHTTPFAANPAYIAARGGSLYYFNGQLDDVRVYNYALTQDQIKLIFNGGASLRFGN